ncbi:hypothetical protein X756_31475 [Mesorhizobium sp. LSHC412B00]|nr:hypothetical protein X756_31475 [Mesorhizobium sp. LSHC412B00]
MDGAASARKAWTFPRETADSKDALAPCKASQFRYIPVGFTLDFHRSDRPLWVVVLQGQMEITLQDGSLRTFKLGDCFFAENLLWRSHICCTPSPGIEKRGPIEALYAVFMRAGTSILGSGGTVARTRTAELPHGAAGRQHNRNTAAAGQAGRSRGT